MKKYLLLAAATMALAACNNDDNYVDQPVAAQITATIGNSTLSRASNETWAPDDAIGVTMNDRYVNLKYITENGDGKFAGTTMYFMNKRESVTLTAYYPFAGDENTLPGTDGIIETSTTSARQTADEQPKVDYLYAKEESVTGTNPNVSFTFSHKMGKITFIFKNGNDGTNVSKITSYQIDGLILDGTFNTETGVCAAKTDADSESLIIDLRDVDVETEVAVPSLIVFPQAANSETVKLKISDSDGQDYACTLNFEDNCIESGNNYQFTITVNKTGLIVNQSGITDWTTKKTVANADAIDPE